MIDLCEVREALRQNVYDPEIGINVVDLGLIYDLQEPEEGTLYVKMTMTTPGCPAHDSIAEAVEWAAAQVFGVAEVKVDVVWDPPWSPERMSEEARQQLYG
ncbi:metal-sulfur cluster assembly factor [Alicyclobacillus macrosporangiidus]|uniref:Metal-sulfur cluster biosynthetic enzyme n=1 Tax=Alicyclobacillus macrosporangiidus TaxID=392015 RepID=A0A1I7F5C1_9BACL|nr:metal-sulfur cluster assembly factor [Alicyclobacillus macrosporangiidus]SFU31350.1 Metal-sulfur cluster biosynthetic enzyme [Alicyclobacillus macrosporangiidus]